MAKHFSVQGNFAPNVYLAAPKGIDICYNFMARLSGYPGDKGQEYCWLSIQNVSVCQCGEATWSCGGGIYNQNRDLEPPRYDGHDL